MNESQIRAGVSILYTIALSNASLFYNRCSTEPAVTAPSNTGSSIVLTIGIYVVFIAFANVAAALNYLRLGLGVKNSFFVFIRSPAHKVADGTDSGSLALTNGIFLNLVIIVNRESPIITDTK